MLATIGTTSTVGCDFVMTVDDGSGALEVVLDKDITFNLTPLVGGTIVDVTGVLVQQGQVRGSSSPGVRATFSSSNGRIAPPADGREGAPFHG